MLLIFQGNMNISKFWELLSELKISDNNYQKYFNALLKVFCNVQGGYLSVHHKCKTYKWLKFWQYQNVEHTKVSTNMRGADTCLLLY